MRHYASAYIAPLQLRSIDLICRRPTVRTSRFISQHFGDNIAAREACLALAKGEPLSQPLQRALFRLGMAKGLEDGVMRSIMKQASGVGVTPHELARLEAAAVKADVHKEYLNGFGSMAAENGGCVSVGFEAGFRSTY